ncbi:MAG: hypothetical protein K1000chlam2_00043 [Chlamydiae bacterium]|nr:hypothetical protein [Chlamydiota bacterium]
MSIIREKSRESLSIQRIYAHYNIDLAKKLGSIKASIFFEILLSFYDGESPYEKIWICFPMESAKDLLAQSRKEQDTAIKKLIEHGLIEKKVIGVPPKRCFSINFDGGDV